MRITARREASRAGVASARTGLRLQVVCTAIEKRFRHPVSLDCAADLAGMERTYFSREFKKFKGMGFAAWLQEVRIVHAKDLLVGTEMRITDIALASGFGDLGTFERRFRQSVGLSPRRYRCEIGGIDMASRLRDFHAGF